MAEIATPVGEPHKWALAEAECLLGLLLTDGSHFERVRHALEPSDFVLAGHQAIWAACLAVDEVELLTIEAALAQRGQTEAVAALVPSSLARGPGSLLEGLLHLQNLAIQRGAMPWRLGHYAGEVARAAHRRRMLDELRDLEARVRDDAQLADADTWASFVAGSHARVAAIAGSGRVADAALDMQTATTAGLDLLCKRAEAQHFASFGLAALDSMTCPDAGDLVVLAARPSMGKSALMTSMLRELQLEQAGNSWEWHPREHAPPALVASVEMQNEALLQRMWSDVGTIDGRRIRRPGPDFLPRAGTQLAAAVRAWEASRVSWVPWRAGAPSLERIEATARAWRARHPAGTGVLFVDYLQLLASSIEAENRNLEIGKMCKRFKALAGALGVVVVLLAQLNRGLERRDSKIPTLADLRDSGEIEQDADIIVFVHRPVRYAPNTDERELAEKVAGLEALSHRTEAQQRELEDGSRLLREAWIIAAKARNGQVGRLLCEYHRAFTRFTAPREAHQHE